MRKSLLFFSACRHGTGQKLATKPSSRKNVPLQSKMVDLSLRHPEFGSSGWTETNWKIESSRRKAFEYEIVDQDALRRIRIQPPFGGDGRFSGHRLMLFLDQTGKAR